MTPTVRKFVEIIASVHHAGPVVEFGSYQCTGLAAEPDLRPLFTGVRYCGCDLKHGGGVDVLGDCRTPPFSPRSIGTVLCCEILEHCADPGMAVGRALELLSDDGLLIVTTPFMFGIHHMPDYWRFTPQGLDLLLSGTMHRAVYFKGDVWIPSVILAIASRTYAPFRRVELALDARLGELPAVRDGEQVYRWSDEENYCRLRYQYMKPVETKFFWESQV